MRKFVGCLCILLGAALMYGALSLSLSNRREEQAAEESVKTLVPLVQQLIPPEPEEEAEAELLIPRELLTPGQMQMTQVEIDGYGYIGCLSIPALGLELPVMGDWDYERLRIAPCRYAGTLLGEDLVIMAHNYVHHFGRLSGLKVGDQVIFKDMDGIVTVYEVAARDVLPGDAVEEMTAGEFDLTLFTCTYGGESRVTVFCEKVKS